MGRWKWLAERLTKRIWFRATLISLFSVALALAASWLAPLIPYDISLKIGAEAADNILAILATSMLAVTTFSMAAMVTAFSSAAQNVTPRAAQLLIEDRTAQNALSTFLGGFLFGVVGIAALSTDFYGAEGRAILFVGTVLMIGWIAITLLRWIEQLTRFGRMEDAIGRVEKAAREAVERHDGPILLSGTAGDRARPGWASICAPATGYVTHVDLSELDENCRAAGAAVEIAAVPGNFVDGHTPLAWVDTTLNQDRAAELVEGFTIEHNRRFQHDPRFGMIVLSEIASRALSPAVNDPGSAISVLTAGQRVAETLLGRAGKAVAHEGPISGYALSLEEMLEDLILPIARDGAGMAEVQIRLQLVLRSLGKAAPLARPATEKLADEAMSRARVSGMADYDLRRVERARVGP